MSALIPVASRLHLPIELYFITAYNYSNMLEPQYYKEYEHHYDRIITMLKDEKITNEQALTPLIYHLNFSYN